MILKKILFFFLIISSIISCTSMTLKENPVTQNISRSSCPISELENFMTFGVYFSSLSNQDKQIECKQLRFDYNILGDWSAGWALAYAINDYSACGTINEGIGILEKIHDSKINNEQIKWLIKQQLVLLKRLKKIEKQNQQRNQELKLTKKQLFNCQDEKSAMKLKLHELKSIETSINQRLEEKQNESN